MTNPYRELCAELTDDLEEWVDGYLINDPADEHTSASFERINRARALLAQSEPSELTDEELLEIRDGACCPGADEVNDEDDSMWEYTSDYIGWLYDQGTVEEQQQYEAKGLRAVFNAGRRTRLH